jgi:hypothetical protein
VISLAALAADQRVHGSRAAEAGRGETGKRAVERRLAGAHTQPLTLRGA